MFIDPYMPPVTGSPFTTTYSATKRAIWLAGERLRVSLSWRLTRIVAVVVAIVQTIAVIYLGSKGLGDQVHSVVTRTAIVVAWLIGSATAFWNAGDRDSIDLADGIDTLARTHGISSSLYSVGRLFAPALSAATLIVSVCTPVLIASIAAAPSAGIAVSRVVSLLPLCAFAAGVGLVVGPMSRACALLSPRHGRTWLVAIVFVPWFLGTPAASWKSTMVSVPGVLGFLSDLVDRTGGSQW